MPEERVKFALRISPQIQKLVKDMCPRDNCQSQNEFIEKAIIYYAGFISSKDSTEFLNSTLLSAIGGTVHDSENRIARMIFKLSVELSMLTNVVASKLNVSNIDLRELRRECVDAVKRSNGTIELEKAAREKQGL